MCSCSFPSTFRKQEFGTLRFHHNPPIRLADYDFDKETHNEKMGEMEKKLIWENSFSVFNHLQAKANVKQQGKRFRTLSSHQRTRKDKMKIVAGYSVEEKELRKSSTRSELTLTAT